MTVTKLTIYIRAIHTEYDYMKMKRVSILWPSCVLLSPLPLLPNHLKLICKIMYVNNMLLSEGLNDLISILTKMVRFLLLFHTLQGGRELQHIPLRQIKAFDEVKNNECHFSS